MPFTSKKISFKKIKNLSGEYDPHSVLLNVVGVLQGQTLPTEIVLFTAHYDHLGIGTPDTNGDKIYNGANDNASGTTALLMLADYFSKQKNNKRTLIFCAFAGEELGALGSSVFSEYLKPSYIKSVINIEMIGHNKNSKPSFFITGFPIFLF